MAQYGTIITNIGLAQIANAQITQTKVGLEYIALGDGNGAHYVPKQNQTALVHEVWRGPIAELSIDPTNSNRIIIDAVIPVTAGGFTIREIGIFDDKNNLIAVGQYPEKYKPQLSEGVSEETLIHFVIETNNADVVKLTIDPTVIIASRNYVDGKVAQVQTALTEHSGHDVLSENGAHGIRYFNGKLETENGENWSEIEIGKPNANGTVKITDNHAIRSFPSIVWDNNTNKEEIRFTFNDFKVSGYFKLKMATNRNAGSNANGGAEVIIQTSTDISTGQILISEMNIVTMHDAFAASIGTAIAWVDDGTNKLYIPVIKKSKNVPLHVEIDYVSSYNNAFEVLDGIEIVHILGNVPDTSPAQKSIFNSKADKEQETWINCTMQNSWLADSGINTLKYRKDEFGIVNVRGQVYKEPNTTATSIITTLPVGYRPTSDMYAFITNFTSPKKATVSRGGQIEVSGLTVSQMELLYVNIFFATN